MPLKAALPALKNAWYKLCSESLTTPVFKDVVPPGTTSGYVLISGETSSQYEYNNSAFLQSAIIKLEYIVKASVMQNPISAEIDMVFLNNQILPTPTTTNLNVIGFQVTSIRLQSMDQLVDDDGINPIFKYILRYEHLLNQI